VRTLRVNADRMAEELARGYTQATDLAEHLVQTCGVDYRTAYVVVGHAVRTASREGVPGIGITGEMIDRAAVEHTGRSWDLAGVDLSAVLDPWRIVLSRGAQGGAAPSALAAMVSSLGAVLDELDATAADRLGHFDRVEQALLDTARAVVTEEE